MELSTRMKNGDVICFAIGIVALIVGGCLADAAGQRISSSSSSSLSEDEEEIFDRSIAFVRTTPFTDVEESVIDPEGDILCQISFRMEGGHVETWELRASKAKSVGVSAGKKRVLCTFSPQSKWKRSSGALLRGFSMDIAPLKGNFEPQIIRVEAWDNEGLLLQGDDYVLDGPTIRNSFDWRRILSKLIVEVEV
eukprot:TRINITY_DN80241_c0_g1_i1.p1 TRINITY_DN80241_c0_g1~~TRINITY_DN80241_c0_g1_i1.p1  ORF type:complete len:217 (-),score=36.32 TRINITY_DN80241_c0_g1_i1:141-722(-)